MQFDDSATHVFAFDHFGWPRNAGEDALARGIRVLPITAIAIEPHHGHIGCRQIGERVNDRVIIGNVVTVHVAENRSDHVCVEVLRHTHSQSACSATRQSGRLRAIRLYFRLVGYNPARTLGGGRLVRGHVHHSRMVTACAVLGVALLALTACSGESAPAITLPAQADADISDETATLIDEAVAHAIESSASTGAIAGVWAPWAGASVKGYGVTEIDGDTKMTADMAFRIGANTRPMTCAVLLALVDDGVVELGDKVSEYLPTTVGVDGLTLEHLCQGTSGLGGYRGNLDTSFIQNPERVWSPNELYNDGMATHAATPGESFSTADTGYIVLGQALESATGKTFSELYNTYIFAPLGLDNTELPAPTDTELPDSALHSYEAMTVAGKLQCDKPYDESKLSSSIGYTSAGVVSTADDLRAFSQAFAHSKLFSEDAAQNQENTRAISDDAESWIQYGFGTYHYGPLYGQSGDVPGFITASLSDPASGLTVVVMLNNSTAGSSLALSLAMQLASYASKLPAASGSKAPSIDLPWSAEQMNDQVSDRAVCQG